MFRLSLLVFCVFLGSFSALAQLPNRNGQIWYEYPVILPPGSLKKYESKAGLVEENTTPLCIVEYIRRETGEAAWLGENFGLISYDGQKLYVYHAPAMQQRVAEIVARFTRPETRNVQFETQARFVTISDQYAKEKGLTDFREPIYQYLHPIVTPDGKPVCQTPGMMAYWVAKDDIAKLDEGLHTVWGWASSNSRSNILTAPQMTAYNGQLVDIRDETRRAFITDVIPVQQGSETEYKPITTVLNEGQTIQSFSLLSWDRRTATTDVSAGFAKITKVSSTNFVGTELQRPHLEKIELSAQGLVWPVDGMLIVIFGGINRPTEGRVDVKMPILFKVPYAQRIFNTHTIRQDTASILAILTVKMVDESSTRAVGR